MIIAQVVMRETVEQIGLLILIAAVVSMVARRLRVPYTVGLTVAGIAVALVPGAPVFSLTRDLIFSVFLPPLIFEASIQMEWPRLKRELPVSAVLSTLGVILSAAAVATGVHLALGWGWPAGILVGILVSATDPVAVVATLREAGITGRLQMLLESESLFNDGTAAVLFAIALTMASGVTPTLGPSVFHFVVVLCGSVVCGAGVGGLALLLAGKSEDHLIEITFTSIAAYGSFLLAEHFGFSGVLATLAAGVLLGNVGPLKAFSEKGRLAVESFWEYVGFAANSLIFLLIGMSLATHRMGFEWKAAVVLIGLALLGRAIAVYGCSALFAGSKHRVDVKFQHVLFWGGLRGALALALVLGLPPDFENREQILTATFAIVAFSVIVQGVSIAPLIKKLGIAGTPLPQDGPSSGERDGRS